MRSVTSAVYASAHSYIRRRGPHLPAVALRPRWRGRHHLWARAGVGAEPGVEAAARSRGAEVGGALAPAGGREEALPVGRATTRGPAGPDLKRRCFDAHDVCIARVGLAWLKASAGLVDCPWCTQLWPACGMRNRNGLIRRHASAIPQKFLYKLTIAYIRLFLDWRPFVYNSLFIYLIIMNN